MAGEKTYNARWLFAVVGGPLLLGLAAAAWMFTVADRLPAELASHWNSSNEVDGWMSLPGAAWMAVAMGAVGALMALLAICSRSQSLMVARLGVGFGVALGVGLVALSVAIVAGQMDLVDTSKAGLSAPVMAVGIALAVVLGCPAGWLYRPGAVDRMPSVEVQSVAAGLANTPVPEDVAHMAANGEALTVHVSMGAWKWPLVLGTGGVVAGSTLAISPWLALLGVPMALLVWAFCQGTAVIGPGGVKVLASGFWKLMPATYKDIRSAAVQDIKAMDFGGWGYRLGGGSTAFITGSGPALVLETGFHQRLVISMPDAATAGRAASLVTAYLLSGSVKQ